MRPNVKYMVIFRHKDKYSISEMCRFFNVSRSGYYGFIKRMNKPDKDLPLTKLIEECQEECKYTYGYRRVSIWLDKKKHHHNPKTVLRIMQKYNLLSVIRRKKYHHYGVSSYKYPNLLNRDFKADKPNLKWATDISYIPTKQGFLYLSVIRDLYDNSIIAYKTATQPTVNLVLNTIRAAKRKEKVTAELQLHSDQGSLYTSQEYFNLTQSYGIKQSMSRRGNPYDNALAENFFSILKTKCISRIKLNSFAEAKRVIDDYIYFYNHQRIQLKTKLMPIEYRRQFVVI